MYKVSIGIDCAPGTPRPDSYVDESDGLTRESAFFGAWTFIKTVETEEEGNRLLDKYHTICELQYAMGNIRGAVFDIEGVKGEK
jgi:hypothetical protein